MEVFLFIVTNYYDTITYEKKDIDHIDHGITFNYFYDYHNFDAKASTRLHSSLLKTGS